MIKLGYFGRSASRWTFFESLNALRVHLLRLGYRGEVAVGCVLVQRQSGRILAVGHNETNRSCNGCSLWQVISCTPFACRSCAKSFRSFFNRVCCGNHWEVGEICCFQGTRHCEFVASQQVLTQAASKGELCQTVSFHAMGWQGQVSSNTFKRAG